MSMTITGTIKVKGETTEVGAKSFKKRDFVISDNSGKFAQHISIQLTGDKCGLLDGVGVGDEVTVHINIRGREWTSPAGEVKYFNSLEAWKIDTISKAAVSTGNALDDFMGKDEPANDMPF